jgi:uncharacterized membrane protein
MEPKFSFTPKEIEDGKVMAGIAYFGIIGFLIAFLVGKDNRFTLYHAQQALIVAILSFFTWIPFLGWIIVSLAVLILFIIGIINGFSGKVAPLPVVGNIGFKFNLLKPDSNPPSEFTQQ